MSRHPALKHWHTLTIRMVGFVTVCLALVLPFKISWNYASAEDLTGYAEITDADESLPADGFFDRLGIWMSRFFDESPPVRRTDMMALDDLSAYQSISELEPRINDEIAEAQRIIAASSPYDGVIERCAAEQRMDPDLLRALIRQESNFRADARSGAGALGLTQLMPATAEHLGVKRRLDTSQSICGGAKYLRWQYDRFGSVSVALAAYNAGPETVRKAGGAIPQIDETVDHGKRILGYYKLLREYRDAQRREETTRVY